LDADSLAAAAAGDNKNRKSLLTLEDTNTCCSQQINAELVNDIKVLFLLYIPLLCIDLNDYNDVPLFLFENEPWLRLLKNLYQCGPRMLF
jgi:hypothetical protein